jgi:hypothetical protein
LIYLILRDTNLEEVFNAIASANVILVGLAVLSNVVGLFISALRWQILMRAQDVLMAVRADEIWCSGRRFRLARCCWGRALCTSPIKAVRARSG